MQGSNTLTLPLEREIVKEVEYPRYMNYDFINEWSDGIPTYSESDPQHPEWKATPIVFMDLSQQGYGEVYIKNESDRNSNKTGTIKDRAAWELATLYRDYAQCLYLKIKAGNIKKPDLERIIVPRLSLITAGNEGRAIAECFKTFKLPPPKIILDRSIPTYYLEKLKSLRADIYIIDLSSKALFSEDIKKLSNNEGGIDLTSIRSIEPHAVFYDWHVHEVFNEKPDTIYIPYGSGRLMENYLTWQIRSIRNKIIGKPDPRLKVDTVDVISINVIGAEPKKNNSIADKLGAPFKPFVLFKDDDINGLVNFAFTGTKTGKEFVEEERIKQAYELMQAFYIEAEPSSAAGLALYLTHYAQGLIEAGKKIMIVNTGKGIE